MKTSSNLAALDRIGGHPAIDFVNTVGAWRHDRPWADYLHDWPALLEWHRRGGLITAADARRLETAGARSKGAAHRQALGLRTALYRLLLSIARGKPPPEAELKRLERTLGATQPWRHLSAGDRSLRWNWDFEGAPPAALLGPVAWEAAELLQHGPLARIKQCPDRDNCGWLFIDNSRNKSRTWCSMKTCGNVAKARRFRKRHP